MVEGGPTLAAALVAADLVDEAILFHSDKVVGPDGIEALEATASTMLKQRLKLVATEPVGSDRQQTYERR
jgi:diaminohydroxyphosphoribosylaminopyrimidine deaminase/5-amino-6-(5-phosphoribosylamino)uracil reductase